MKTMIGKKMPKIKQKTDNSLIKSNRRSLKTDLGLWFILKYLDECLFYLIFATKNLSVKQ